MYENDDEIRCVYRYSYNVHRWSVVRLTASAYPTVLSVRFKSCSGRSTCTASEYFPVCTRCWPRAVTVSIAVLLPTRRKRRRIRRNKLFGALYSESCCMLCGCDYDCDCEL